MVRLQKRSAMSALKLVPAVEENFFKDRCFADQRVAGANPFQIWRVTKEGGRYMTKNINQNSCFERNIHVNEIIPCYD